MFGTAVVLALLCAALARSLPVRTRMRQVHVVSRHCDCSPMKDLLIPKIGPVDFVKLIEEPPRGELTNLGLHQCAELGAILRSRYVDDSSLYQVSAIPASFTVNQYAFSATTTNRALRSSGALSQGLFPHDRSIGQVLDNEARTRPRKDSPPALPNATTIVPVSSERPANDVELSALSGCPVYDEKLKTYFEDDQEWKSVIASTAHGVSKLKQELGYVGPHAKDVKNLEDWADVWDYINTLRAHHIWDGLSDASQAFLESLNNRITAAKYSRAMIGNFGGGFLVSSIWNKMKKVMSAGGPSTNHHLSGPQGFLHYMGNAETVLAVLTALRLSSDYPVLGRFPAPGATLALELHQDIDTPTKWYVQAVVLSSTNTTTSTWTPYMFESLGNLGCQSDLCDGGTFGVIVQDAVPFDWCDECGNKATEFCLRKELKSLSRHKVICWIVTGVVFVVALLLFGCFPLLLIKDYCRKPKRRDYSYMPNDE